MVFQKLFQFFRSIKLFISLIFKMKMVKENGQKRIYTKRTKRLNFCSVLVNFQNKRYIIDIQYKVTLIQSVKKKRVRGRDEGREKKMCKRSSRDFTRNFGEASGEIAGEIQSRIERMGRNHRIKVFHRETQSVSEIFTSRTSENRFILKRKKIQWSRFKKYVGFCKWNHTCFSMSTH